MPTRDVLLIHGNRSIYDLLIRSITFRSRVLRARGAWRAAIATLMRAAADRLGARRFYTGNPDSSLAEARAMLAQVVIGDDAVLRLT